MPHRSYAAKKLTEVLESIATHEGDARKRVEVAFLYLIHLNETDFPKDMKADWDWIWKEATKYGPLHDHHGNVWRGSVENTMRRIKNSTASKILKKIYELYWGVTKNRPYC